MSKRILLLLLLPALTLTANAAGFANSQCVAGAKAGGGFDLTCKLAQQGLLDGKFISAPMRISYLPGGIGALAFNAFVTQRRAEAETLVAFSSGTLLNLAQGKFGPNDEDDVRWVAGIAADYGVVVVAANSPYKTLKDLMASIKLDPSKTVFGAGGTVGSQDWMKAALTARAAGVQYRNMRLVAFEGGGEALTALQGGHVQVCTVDASETIARIAAGAPLRVLAVMSEQRLPGSLAQIPTAREAGYDITWPIVRGFYVGRQVTDEAYKAWAEAFKQMLASSRFQELRAQSGLFAFSMVGSELESFVKRDVEAYRKFAKELGLKVAR